MNLSIGVVTILFTLSLVAAWILFKFLQSTASINRKEYQMGGAEAGFLIIYGVLNYSYTSIAKISADDTNRQLQACLATEEEVPVKGTVDPALADAEVVYATKTISLADNGVFYFSARKKDIKSSDPPTIYVTTEQKQGE
jgi:hypothetical protein